MRCKRMAWPQRNLPSSRRRVPHAAGTSRAVRVSQNIWQLRVPMQEDCVGIAAALESGYGLAEGGLLEGPHADVAVGGTGGYLCAVCVDLDVVDLTLNNPDMHDMHQLASKPMHGERRQIGHMS